jgi:hypothetical protein
MGVGMIITSGGQRVNENIYRDWFVDLLIDFVRPL